VLPVRFRTVLFFDGGFWRRPCGACAKRWRSFSLTPPAERSGRSGRYVKHAAGPIGGHGSHLAAEKEADCRHDSRQTYFLEQKIKGQADKDVAAWLKEMGRDILSAAKKMSVGFSECRLQSRDVREGMRRCLFMAPFSFRRLRGGLQRLLSRLDTAHQDAGLCLSFPVLPPYNSFRPGFAGSGYI